MLAFCFAKTPPTCPGRTASTLHHPLAHFHINFSIETIDYDHGFYQMSTGKQTKSFNLFHSPQRPAANNINLCLEMTLVSHTRPRKEDFPPRTRLGVYLASRPICGAEGISSNQLLGRKLRDPTGSRCGQPS